MRRVAFVCAVALALPAAAVDLGDGKLELAGFGEVAYGRTNGNTYLAGTKKGSYENGEFALAVLARPREDLLVGAQTTFLLGGGAELDWAFGEYRLSDKLRLRMGKSKLPFGIYEEIEAVGTLRPLFYLPQAVYGPNLLASDSYVGLGATGRFDLGKGWVLQYDAFAGALHLDVMEPQALLLPDASAADAEVHDEQARDAIGGRLILSTPVDGLNVRFSAWRGTEMEDDVKLLHAVFGPSVEYVGDHLTARAEGFKMIEGESESLLAGYLELAWMFDAHWQIAGRADYSRATFPGVPSSSPFLHHRELCGGINYWFTPQLVLKASYHDVRGNRFALPEGFGPGSPTPDDRTQLFVLGTQFSF